MALTSVAPFNYVCVSREDNFFDDTELMSRSFVVCAERWLKNNAHIEVAKKTDVNFFIFKSLKD